MKQMKPIRLYFLLTLLLILAAGQAAWATTKTVTYTLDYGVLVDHSSYKYVRLTLDGSGDTPFEGAITIEPQLFDNRTSAYFTLADGFTFSFVWGSAQSLKSNGTSVYHDEVNLQYTVSWGQFGNIGVHYYVTNIQLTDYFGNAMKLNGGGTATTDYTYSEQGNKSYTAARGDASSAGLFKKLVITYSDAPGLDIFTQQGGSYLIQNANDLRRLADYVNKGYNDCQGLSFSQTSAIDFKNVPKTYDGGESNYVPIGIPDHAFCGTYDGRGQSISGITVQTNGYIGVFGNLGSGGTVQGVVLSSSTMEGANYSAGIAGYSEGTIQNCRVENSVIIRALNNYSDYHGGIAGQNNGSIIGCLSAANVTDNGMKYCNFYGGIAGRSQSGTFKNCLYAGTSVSAESNVSAVCISNANNSKNNYYTSASLSGLSADDISVKLGRTVTLGANVALADVATTYNVSGLTAFGNTVLSYNNGTTTTIYSGSSHTFTLGYTGNQPDAGYMLVYHTTGGQIYNDNKLWMPAADVTVTVTVEAITYTLTYAGLEGSTVTPDNPGSYTIETPSFTLSRPSRVGYTFDGWTGTDLSEKTLDVTIDQGSTGDRTYTATWTKNDPWNGVGTQEEPYSISSRADLLTLAERVNGGSSYNGVYFVQTADIAFNPQSLTKGENFTAIGTSEHPFGGFYDGGHHFISGIRINKTGTAASDGYQGLFGHLASGGSISNLFLTDAVIEGHTNTGAIVGYKEGTLSTNYYFGCTVNGSSVNVGSGDGDLAENDGACRLSTITRGKCVTFSGTAALSFDGTDYYKAGTQITLGGDFKGYTFEGYTVDGVLIDGDTFPMPGHDVSVAASLTVPDWTGSGTDADPWRIYYTSQMDLLAERVNSGTTFAGQFFRVCADLIYDSTDLYIDGGNYVPVGTTKGKSFMGSFDGDGHTISGIRINKPDDMLGIFASVENGEVKNITLSDSHIFGSYYIAGIVGIAIDNTLVTNCHVDSSVIIGVLSTENQRLYHGGIVGAMTNCTITGCSSAARILDGGYKNCSGFGGIVGRGRGTGIVKDCLFTGTIENTDSDKNTLFGGIVGSRNGDIEFSNNYYILLPEGTLASSSGCGGNPNSAATDLTDNDGAVEAQVSNEKPEEIGAQTAAYPHGLTVYEHGVFFQNKYYTRKGLTCGWIRLVRGTLNGVTAYWGTFYSNGYNFTLPEGAEAFILASDYTLCRLGDDGRTIPKGVPVVIMALLPDVTPTVTVYLVQEGTGDLNIDRHGVDNILHASADTVTVTDGQVDGNTPYVLSVSGSAIGFRRFTGASIPAGKAFYVVTP